MLYKPCTRCLTRRALCFEVLEHWLSISGSGSGWLSTGPPIPSQELNPVARAKALGHLVSRAEGTAQGWLNRATTTSRSWQWKDNGSVVAWIHHGSLDCPN
ncbi:hypothetical protein PRUPE_2G142600 [Prunus persica]|uniref:Uncharacterized protein n=1 Tax=Prunus persica TaxID=3760 RepID=A0A251QFR7_PRUPE|nr:hypothetical protein PRUPE_2G142600 [Prunus persica]